MTPSLDLQLLAMAATSNSLVLNFMRASVPKDVPPGFDTAGHLLQYASKMGFEFQSLENMPLPIGSVSADLIADFIGKVGLPEKRWLETAKDFEWGNQTIEAEVKYLFMNALLRGIDPKIAAAIIAVALYCEEIYHPEEFDLWIATVLESFSTLSETGKQIAHLFVRASDLMQFGLPDSMADK